MKFRGFMGEDIRVLKRVDVVVRSHDHLIINIDGKEVGYFHIFSDGLHFFNMMNEPTNEEFSISDLRH